MRRALIMTSGVLLLAGCGSSGADEGVSLPTGGPSTAAPAPSAPAPAVAGPAASAPAAPASAAALAKADAALARSVDVSNDLYEFKYDYPAVAGAIPALKALLDRDLDVSQARVAAEAKTDQADARKSGYPFHPHSAVTDWKVVTHLPQWLSLSAQIYGYSGGAHGMTTFDTLVWDKAAGVKRMPLDLFASPGAFAAAVRAPLCAALNVERRKRRGADYDPGDKMFGGCIDPVKEARVILGSRDRKAFERIGFLIDPYVAGPYAEGPYEITLPVTPAVLATVRPEYRAAFAR